MVSSRILIVSTSAAVAVAAVGVWYFVGRKQNKRKERTNTRGIITFVDLKQKIELKLVKKVIISPNTRLFRFQLPSTNHVAGLLPGQHVELAAIVDGKSVTRKYTPVSDDELTGHVDLVIKIYFANQHPNFLKGGVLSQYLDSLEIGDTVTFTGPVTRIIYAGGGVFTVRKLSDDTITEKRVKSIGILVGGTGITPMLQIINHILKNPDDKTDIWMLYANNTLNDVLLKDNLDSLTEKHPNQFHVWYTVSIPDEKWAYSVGRVNEQMIAQHLPSAHQDHAVLLCGPPGLKQQAAIPNLLKLGYTKEQILDF